MMKKRSIALLLICVLTILTAVGCGSTEQNAVENVEKDVYKVAFVTRSQNDTFAVWLAEEMKLAAEQYDDMELDVFDGKADDEVENQAILDAIEAGYDAIIVQPNNGEAQRPYVEKIVESGIVAVTTNSKIEGIEGSSAVDSDPYAQALANIEGALTLVPEGARVVILKGPAGNYHADERYKAWKAEFFKLRPDVVVVGEGFADWEKDRAKKLMTDWARAIGQVDAIISMNDNMAIGAWEAIKDDPLYDNTLIFGVDGTPEMCYLIEQGEVTSTSLQSAIELAELNLEVVHKLLTGEETRMSENIRTTVINKVNVGKYMELYRERGLITE